MIKITPHPEVIKQAKDMYFPALNEMPENVIEGFLNWAADKKKDPEVDNTENREMMIKMACFCRASWMF